MLPDSPEILSAVLDALAASLSLTGSEATLCLFRSWADPLPPPPPPSRNICYYDLQTDPDAPLLQEQEYFPDISARFSFVPCRLTLVFYGPDCEAWAHRCRLYLFQDGHGFPLSILRQAGLYPVPSPRPPSVVYEELAKVHRKRADLTVHLCLADHSAYGPADGSDPVPVPQVRVPPGILLHRDS